MLLNLAFSLYVLGLVLMPVSSGGWVTPATAIYCLSATAIGAHAARNARRLAGDQMALIWLCRLLPVLLPALLLVVRQIAR